MTFVHFKDVHLKPGQSDVMSGGHLGHGDHEMTEFSILREGQELTEQTT